MPARPELLRESRHLCYGADFMVNDGSGSAPQATTAEVCWSAAGLAINFTATDNNVQTNYSQCQDSVWRMDAL